MAIEIRRIIFQPDELTKIIKKHFSPSDPTLQGGTIMMVDIAGERPVTGVAHIQKDGRTFSYAMNEADLIGCVIGYCLNKRIPMSKEAKKSLNRNDKGITFDMVIQSNLAA